MVEPLVSTGRKEIDDGCTLWSNVARYVFGEIQCEVSCLSKKGKKKKYSFCKISSTHWKFLNWEEPGNGRKIKEE
jgi:hypothetical protein